MPSSDPLVPEWNPSTRELRVLQLGCRAFLNRQSFGKYYDQPSRNRRVDPQVPEPPQLIENPSPR